MCIEDPLKEILLIWSVAQGEHKEGTYQLEHGKGGLQIWHKKKRRKRKEIRKSKKIIIK